MCNSDLLITSHESRITNHAFPILMYHSISNEPEPGVAPYYRTNTSPAAFRRQMQHLADNGYQTISLAQAVRHLHSEPASATDQQSPITNYQSPDFDHASRITHHASCSKPVLLTFDDGFRDFYTHAFPILQEYNFTATVFLPTAFIRTMSSSPHQGEGRDEVPFPVTYHASRITGPSITHQASRPTPASLPAAFQHAQFLSWSEVRELHRAGITFGSHTVTHPKLVDLDWPRIRSEISNSKSEIEQQLGESIDSFCYPFAFPQANHSFVDRFTELLIDAGYTSCMTTQVGRVEAGSDLFSLKRLPMNDCDDTNLFRAKLEGAYDWMGVPQSCIKRCKSWLG